MTAMATHPDQHSRDTLVALGNTTVPRQSWAPDGTGVEPSGIVGGDGAGEAVSVRFLNRYLPNAMITVHLHVVDLRERSSDPDAESAMPFMVEEMIEYLISKNAIGDGSDLHEVWSDYTYAYANSRRMATEEEAEAVRDRLAAAQSTLGVGERFYWDGTPQ